MKIFAFAALGAIACSTPTTDLAASASCSARLQEIDAAGWEPDSASSESETDLAFAKSIEGQIHHRSLHCEADRVLVDVEWTSFATEERARQHYDRRLEDLAETCTTSIIEPRGFPEEPRFPKPLSSTTYFSTAVSYLAIAGCLDPGEKRILSLARSDSHGVRSGAETDWSVEFNRQPNP